MKVLHLVGGELSGGAARGALALHRALVKLGANSEVLTDSLPLGVDERVHSVTAGKMSRVWRSLRRLVDSAPQRAYRKRVDRIFSTGFVGYDFLSHPAYKSADLIHLHWINGAFVSLAHVARIDKPVVWTLRDMWPMTGGCHYAMGCERYRSGCGSCPQLASNSRIDLSSLVAKRKRRLAPARVAYVGISQWLTDEARSSFVLQGRDLRTIPNGIDTSIFRPIDKAVSRSILGISTAKKIVLVGAQSPTHFYKGFGSFLEAIRHLDPARYHLCFFGHTDTRMTESTGFDSTSFGFVHDDVALRLIYSSADVFVAPSHMEAFGKTLAESMACNTPVVCFDIGGPREIVDHRQNGYRAFPRDSADLAAGIEWVCDQPASHDLGSRAREKIVNTFDASLIASEYLRLYRQLLA